MRAYICKLSWYIDVHRLAFAMHQLLDEVRRRDYISLELFGDELESMLKGSRADRKLRFFQASKRGLESFPKNRRSPAMIAFLQRYHVDRVAKPKGTVEEDAHFALALALGDAVSNGAARTTDLKLAAMVAAGKLQGLKLVEALTTTFLYNFERSLANSRKKCSSEHIRTECVQEALCTLGKSSEVQALLRNFHVNPRSIPKSRIFTDQAVDPYCVPIETWKCSARSSRLGPPPLEG